MPISAMILRELDRSSASRLISSRISLLTQPSASHRHDSEIVKLRHRGRRNQWAQVPLQRFDHLYPAPRLVILLGELAVERNPFKALVARFRQSDERCMSAPMQWRAPGPA